VAAVSSGDLQGLVEVLAPDVVLIADGGGLVAAARKPITGVEKVVAFPARAAKVPDIMASTAWLNGMPAARTDVGDRRAPSWSRRPYQDVGFSGW
jgi:hypothetical protein